jgi:hypothetical protein
MHTLWHWTLVFVAASVLSASFSVSVAAQSDTTGALAGQVIDRSAGAISGATVTIIGGFAFLRPGAESPSCAAFLIIRYGLGTV